MKGYIKQQRNEDKTSHVARSMAAWQVDTGVGSLLDPHIYLIWLMSIPDKLAAGSSFESFGTAQEDSYHRLSHWYYCNSNDSDTKWLQKGTAAECCRGHAVKDSRLYVQKITLFRSLWSFVFSFSVLSVPCISTKIEVQGLWRACSSVEMSPDPGRHEEFAPLHNLLKDDNTSRQYQIIIVSVLY